MISEVKLGVFTFWIKSSGVSRHECTFGLIFSSSSPVLIDIGNFVGISMSTGLCPKAQM
jgi:hypothetical protein